MKILLINKTHKPKGVHAYNGNLFILFTYRKTKVTIKQIKKSCDYFYRKQKCKLK